LGFVGLSGIPLRHYVADMLLKVRRQVPPERTIIAVGGIGCDPDRHPAETVWEYLTLGATLVQVHTGLIYKGPGLAKMINDGLARILREKKWSSLSEFLASKDLSVRSPGDSRGHTLESST
jgi:dihydroorotate dehydrogenase